MTSQPDKSDSSLLAALQQLSLHISTLHTTSINQGVSSVLSVPNLERVLKTNGFTLTLNGTFGLVVVLSFDNISARTKSIQVL